MNSEKNQQDDARS